jgi:predicted nucleotidyltransferase
MEHMSPQIPIDRDAVSAFCRRLHITRLGLFGSVLTDDFGPDNDVDVLVEFQAAMFLASSSSASSASSLDYCMADVSTW